MSERTSPRPGKLSLAILRWPELSLPALIWGVIVLIATVRAPLLGLEFPYRALGLITVCLLCLGLPAYRLGIPFPDSPATGGIPARNRLPAPTPRDRAVLLITTVIALAAFALYLYSRRDALGGTTEEAREARWAIAADSKASRLYNIIAPFGLISAFWIMAFQWSWWIRFAYLGLIAGAFVVTYVKSGARFELLPLLIVSAAAFLIHHRHLVVAQWKRAILATAAALLLLGIGNGLLNILGIKDGWASSATQMLISKGATLVQPIGGEHLPEEVLVSLGMMDNYLLMPISHLDFYLQRNDAPAAYGGHQFHFIGRRVGLEDGPEIKEIVDTMYSEIGIFVNCWATALREMAIDFTPMGVPFVFLALGVLLGLAKRHFPNNLGAQFLVSLVLAYSLFSPATSLIKANMFQMGLYLAVAWFAHGLLKNRRQPASLRMPVPVR